jgi:osmotically-inducible protein OsmY
VPIRIEEAVRTALERDPYVEASQIRVGVRHREVRLTGFVASESLKEMAEQDAWCVLGGWIT